MRFWVLLPRSKLRGSALMKFGLEAVDAVDDEVTFHNVRDDIEPHELKILLSDPRVKKVGRMVDTDLRYLQKQVHSRQPFTGGVDLAKLAKKLGV